VRVQSTVLNRIPDGRSAYRAVPDLLSLSRMGLAFVLLLTESLSPVFLLVFLVCGLTDVLDGMVARRFDACSEHGHVLDSVSDVVLVAILLYCVIPAVGWEGWMIVWIAAIAVVRIAAFGIGSVRYGKPAFVHTYMNKAAGLLLFLAPFLLVAVGAPVTVGVVCGVASISSAEYLYINITGDCYDPDLKTVLVRT